MESIKIKTEPSEDKSWVELCEEEYEENANKSINFGKSVVKIEKEEIYKDSNKTVVTSFENICVKSEIKLEKDELPKQISSYANAVKCSPINGNGLTNHFIKTENDITYTPSKEDFPECTNTGRRRSTRRQIQKEFLQEDISLSSHLDVFHMISPCKQESLNDEEMVISNKEERKTKIAKRRINSNPFGSKNLKNSIPDEVLMPSPEKVNSSAKRAKMTKDIKSSRKRQRENSSGSSPQNKDDSKDNRFETDEDILARRQKQIDYGKNTVGYERYRQLVPKDKRDKKHPNTPPKHRKYSRRGWDGLVRIWRQRLHFWDPPSQGGGNSDCLDFGSSFSDVSSCDTASLSSANSQSSTPWKESKRRVRVKHESDSSIDSSDNELN